SPGDRKQGCQSGRFGPPSTRAGCDARFCRGCLGCRRLGASRASDRPDSRDAGCDCRGAILEVPALWPLEVANALMVLVRRRTLTADERQTALGWLRVLPLRVCGDGSAKLTQLELVGPIHS